MSPDPLSLVESGDETTPRGGGGGGRGYDQLCSKCIAYNVQLNTIILCRPFYHPALDPALTA